MKDCDSQLFEVWIAGKYNLFVIPLLLFDHSALFGLQLWLGGGKCGICLLSPSGIVLKEQYQKLKNLINWYVKILMNDPTANSFLANTNDICKVMITQVL
jgi:hypothetical protein